MFWLENFKAWVRAIAAVGITSGAILSSRSTLKYGENNECVCFFFIFIFVRYASQICAVPIVLWHLNFCITPRKYFSTISLLIMDIFAPMQALKLHPKCNKMKCYYTFKAVSQTFLTKAQLAPKALHESNFHLNGELCVFFFHRVGCCCSVFPLGGLLLSRCKLPS